MMNLHLFRQGPRPCKIDAHIINTWYVLDIGMANPPSHRIRHSWPFILVAAASTASGVEGTRYNIPPTCPRQATLLEQHGNHACNNRLSRGRVCIGNEGAKVELRLDLTLSL
jgi:hypothetical protein